VGGFVPSLNVSEENERFPYNDFWWPSRCSIAKRGRKAVVINLSREVRMNNETNSAEFQPEIPPRIEPARSFVLTADARQTMVHWLKRLFACNPFYLVSAALLLFGLYRVSTDSGFMPTEVARLTFNFSSLQLYELLLVGVAMLLAARAIWYDAKLLVVLENLLLLVPFILISQAALIDRRAVTLLSLGTALLATLRFGAAQRWMPALRYPSRLPLCGLALLALNTAWPICYRTFHETKFGAWPTWGAAYHMSQWSWLVLLPLVCALANFLPRPQDTANHADPRRWFSLGAYALWLLGTSIHLYCLSYVYEFKLSRQMFAPAAWVLAWTIFRRLRDFVPEPARGLKVAAQLLPLAAAFAAVGDENGYVFFALNVLNVLAFAGIVLLGSPNRVALHLLLISLAALVAGLPPEWAQSAVLDFSRAKFTAVALLAYLILGTALSRNPKVAIPGAFAAAIAAGLLRGGHGDCGHWAAQGGLVFLLLHSLRWRDREHESAAFLRALASVTWVMHALVWVRSDGAFLQPPSLGVLVLTICWVRWFVFRKWSPMIVPFAAALVGVSTPLNQLIAGLQTVPTGVLIIGASFLLFALGTVAALTRHRWQKHRESSGVATAGERGWLRL